MNLVLVDFICNKYPILSEMNLWDLPPELQEKIISYLSVEDLHHLRLTCKAYKQLVDDWQDVVFKAKSPIATNQFNQQFLSKCRFKLFGFERMRISKNWRTGRYVNESLLFIKSKKRQILYTHRLHLDRDNVWVCKTNKVFNYKRFDNGVNTKTPANEAKGRLEHDIDSFRIKNSLLLCGLREGGMWLKNLRTNRMIFDVPNAHTSDVHSVDVNEKGTLFVSGCRNNDLCLWGIDENNALQRKHQHIMEDRVWKVALCPEQPLLAVGTAGNEYECSLAIFDIETMSYRFMPSDLRGCAMFDLKWDGAHTLWSCGYDSSLKKWDLRIDKCVQTLSDPHNVPMYCMDYDYYNTIVTGCQLDTRVTLWDVRQIKCLQIYYLQLKKQRKFYCPDSSIYSIAFDSTHLYATTIWGLNELSFLNHNIAPVDYSWWLGG